MTLDRIINIYSPLKASSDTGQDVLTYQFYGQLWAAYDPTFGTETYNDRLERAKTTQVFVIRQEDVPTVNSEWLIVYEGKQYKLTSVMEYTPRKATPRGRYFALNATWVNNETYTLV